MFYYAASIFLSAFLIFQIEPMFGKFLLPWFGGTPAVWSTLLLLYQVLLAIAYAYAAWLIDRIKRPAQIHATLVLTALLILAARGMMGHHPVLPSISSVQTINSPILAIIRVLLSSIAFPFFILAANGPLVQAWSSRVHPERSYAQFYAISNLGSLLGLLTYPVLIEPNFTLQFQAQIWLIGFLIFVLLTTWIIVHDGRAPALTRPVPASVSSSSPPAHPLLWLWIALSAAASVLLLSVTNQISQEVAVIPFLWILPLTIYLLSFILTFSGKYEARKKFYALLFIVATLLTLYVMLNATRLHIYWQISAYCLFLFAACMLCHGELYLLRPAAEHLTSYYLMLSIGGSLGGIFVSLLAPLLFNGYWEFFVGLAMTIAVLLTILRSNRDDAARARFIFTVFSLVMGLLTFLSFYSPEIQFAKRNFYGVIRVQQVMVGNPAQRANVMSHGLTVHGLQFVSDFKTSHIATTYYVPRSGVGLAILNHPKYRHNQRVGLLGLGAGTLVAYSQPGDVYRMYEINPVVIDLAAGVGDYFSFVSNSEADITIVPGDARISLQRELDAGESQNFDVLVLDTFSSDSIPVHLLTKEAFALYLAHLAPQGIIAAHITNLHLDLQPVFWQLAQHYGLNMARVDYPGDAAGGYASVWILLTRDPVLLQLPAIHARSVHLNEYSTTIRLWTDGYSNLFQILK
jgi:hypothetical protein